MPTIAIDAMGSDNYPVPDVQGAILAAREFGYHILLVGDKDIINTELLKHDTQNVNIEIVHASEVIHMTDKPSEVTKARTDSSMHVGMRLVKDSKADAFVTAGNTGAVMGIAIFRELHRIRGVKRPALSGIFPVGSKHITFLDLGANADAKPEWLAQFAVMGHIYAQKILHLSEPRLALLSNGEEDIKGSQLINDAAELLVKLPINFVGNVEPKEILQGQVDVIVTDGFVGNIFVKTFEASASYLKSVIRDEIKKDVLSMLGALLLGPAFKRVHKRTDTSEIGGAPLLGVNGIVIIAHGRSDKYAIKNAIHQAGQAVHNQIIDSIRQGVASIDYQASD